MKPGRLEDTHMEEHAQPNGQCRVLHAIVGHKFRHYFINSVNSVRETAAGDDILVVDNASHLTELTAELRSIADMDPRVRLLSRETNDLSRNRKVGGLYEAYNEIMSYAIAQGYDFVHIMQHDMQMLWWDETVMARARELYAEYPECVNIHVHALPRHLALTDELEYIKPKLVRLRNYGLTDTGIYHLARWQALGMRFEHSEAAHARLYLEQGLSVLCHPSPAVAFIPWPAVVRRGRIIGREVRPRHKFLLRPLSAGEITEVKESTDLIWSEDVGIPWGWACLTPYWATDLRTIFYLVYLYRDVRARGLRAAWPRWDRRGLEKGASLRGVQRQPRFGHWQVMVGVALYVLRRTIHAVG